MGWNGPPPPTAAQKIAISTQRAIKADQWMVTRDRLAENLVIAGCALVWISLCILAVWLFANAPEDTGGGSGGPNIPYTE